MLQYRVGLMGSPNDFTVEWSDANLVKLKSLGFNTMQLNIAWGCRPGDEALNMEDVVLTDELDAETRKAVAHRQAQIQYRLAQCKKHGIRSIFHFGAPFNYKEGYYGLPLRRCTMDTDITAMCVGLLNELNAQIPGIDDILLYTFDQDAWQCSEFFHCETCRGIPLHKRLAPFLHAMRDSWNQINPQGMLWWEPWEMSAGQVYSILPLVPDQNFGLSLHANIGEVQKTRSADNWFCNTARLAKNRGIPVIGEIFIGEASEETEPLTRVPCPPLTYAQMHDIMRVEGVVGIKEYYGLVPSSNDPCLEMAGQVFADTTRSLEDCLQAIAAPYGAHAGDVLAMWRHVSDAYMLYPWDASWYAREVGKASLDHGWQSAFIRGKQAPSPSWESTRQVVFMKTDNNEPNPYMREDIGLRCEAAAGEFALACALAEKLSAAYTGALQTQMKETLASLDYFRRVCVSYALHMRETNIANMLRDCGMPYPAHLTAELEALLMRDCENQNGAARVKEALRMFRQNPQVWLAIYLLPGEGEPRERGEFTLTTR